MLLLFSAEMKMKYFFNILLFSSDCDIRGTRGGLPQTTGRDSFCSSRSGGPETAQLPRPAKITLYFCNHPDCSAFHAPAILPSFAFPLYRASCSCGGGSSFSSSVTTRIAPRFALPQSSPHSHSRSIELHAHVGTVPKVIPPYASTGG